MPNIRTYLHQNGLLKLTILLLIYLQVLQSWYFIEGAVRGSTFVSYCIFPQS